MAGIAALYDEAPSTAELADWLSEYGDLERLPSGWMGADPLVLPFRPEVNGVVVVDVVPRVWPDSMGSPEHDPELFSEWAMGGYGPFAFPGSLTRAVEQSRGWPGAQAAVAEHQAFVRLRCTYGIGAHPDQPVAPADYKPVPELLFLHALAATIPSASAIFNMNGVVLHSPDLLDQQLRDAREHGYVPLETFSNVRLYNVGRGWNLMDSVGMAQVELPDVEAAFDDRIDPNQVAGFLRNLGAYLLEAGDVLAAGHTVDGPAGRWVAHRHDDAWVAPPRPVVTMIPEGSTPPAELFPDRPQ